MVCKSGSNSKLGQVIGTTPHYDPADEAYKAVEESRGESGQPSAPVKRKRPIKSGEVETPDLSGYPIREAIQKLAAAGLYPRIEGSGRVFRQDPPAGSVVPAGTTIQIVLEPPT